MGTFMVQRLLCRRTHMDISMKGWTWSGWHQVFIWRINKEYCLDLMENVMAPGKKLYLTMSTMKNTSHNHYHLCLTILEVLCLVGRRVRMSIDRKWMSVLIWLGVLILSKMESFLLSMVQGTFLVEPKGGCSLIILSPIYVGPTT